jgi:hypothetical protein
LNVLAEKQKSPPVYGVGIIKKLWMTEKQKSPPVYGVGIIKKLWMAGKQKSPPFRVGIKKSSEVTISKP